MQEWESRKLLEYHDPNVRTMFDAFFNGAKIAKEVGDERAFGYRASPTSKYTWISYSEVLTRAKALSSGLIQLGLEPGQGSLVGIYSVNCMEWMLTAISCYLQSWIIVPLYTTLKEDGIVHIIKQCELRFCCVENSDVAANLLNVHEQCPSLRLLVMFNAPTEDILKRVSEKGLQLFCLQDVEPPKPTDLIIICYTSGTTGPPKGAMITHGNAIALICAQNLLFSPIEKRGKEVLISYLPLAHILEFSNENFCLYNGYKIGFYRGIAAELMNDIYELRPTLLPTVPRVLNRIYDGIKTNIDRIKIGQTKSLMLKLACTMKRKALEHGHMKKNKLLDGIMFRRIQAKFGGRLKLVLVGSSATLPEVISFLRLVLGCIVIEAYGQTELSGASHSQVPGDLSVRNVGRCLACCTMKLCDVPEMKYFTKNGQGELCIKGFNTFKGYYKDEEKTKEVIDADGWVHTSDIVSLQKNGSLMIIGRKNDVFKLSQGEYIQPTKIETVYLRSDFIDQCFVYGNPYKSYLVAVVIPNKDAVLTFAAENSLQLDFHQLCKIPDVSKAIIDSMDKVASDAHLNGLEKVKAVYLHPEPFTVENGLLTPTMKLKRYACLKRFGKEIDSLYQIRN